MKNKKWLVVLICVLLVAAIAAAAVLLSRPKEEVKPEATAVPEQTEEAKEDAPRMLVFSVLLGVAVGILYAGVAFIAPQLYNTTDSVKHLATQFLLVTAVFMPIEGPLNVSYFLVRSGGKTLITMFTDCGLLWLVQGTTAFFLSEFTNLPVIPLFALVEAGMIVKLAVSLLYVAQGKWAHSVVEEDLTEDRLPSSADA